MTIKEVRPLLKNVRREQIRITDVYTGESINIDDAIYDEYLICNYQLNDDDNMAPMDCMHTFGVKKPTHYLVAYEAETDSWAESWQQHMNEDELKDFIEQLSPDTLKALTITSVKQ